MIAPRPPRRHTAPPFAKKKTAMTRGERVCAFIEKYCCVPEGKWVGRPMRLDQFQRDFILDVYDNPFGTSMAILSIGRKNGKTGLIAGIVLAHVAGPEARRNSQLVSGAMSRDQASIVFKLASKMVRMNEQLSRLIRIVPSTKTLIGLTLDVEYRALSAEGKTAHGLSPVLAILDEVGQVRGPQSDFIDAITTAQGAHDNPLIIVISTQAPNDDDLLSIWIDDAIAAGDPHTVIHLHSTPIDMPLDDREGWAISNPALGTFRSEDDVRKQSEKAIRMPSSEPTFRNLVLNQRVEMNSPFISKGIWILNSSDPSDIAFATQPVWVGLDLSAKNDLTALVLVARLDGTTHVRAYFWTPEKSCEERSKRDRAPYSTWVKQGFITAVPGMSIDYEVVARDMADIISDMDIQNIAFDRWRFDLLKKEFEEAGLSFPMIPFGQGFKDMAPALDSLETLLLNEKVAHGGHPVLTMCAANSRVESDAAGNRKLSKHKATGRIDGMVALTMAVGCMSTEVEQAGEVGVEVW